MYVQCVAFAPNVACMFALACAAAFVRALLTPPHRATYSALQQKLASLEEEKQAVVQEITNLEMQHDKVIK